MTTNLHADRALARALLAQTLPDVLCKFRDVGVSTRTPREVYQPTLHRDGDGSAREAINPRRAAREVARAARHTVDSLAHFHADGDLPSFRELLNKVFRWRDDAFGGDIYRDVMPALALEIDSMDALAAVDWFCVDDPTEPWTPPIDLSLSISMGSLPTPTLEFLARVTALVERLTSPQSHFRVTMVDWTLGELPLDNEHALRATSQLGDALLRRVPTLCVCNVSCRISAGGGDDEGGLRFPHAMGELFQVLLRVGCTNLPEPDAASDGDDVEDADLNRFKVEMVHNAHPRIAAALWSAVAYSCGYAVLELENHVDASHGTARNDEAEAVSIKYLAAAILLGKSDVKRLLWQRAPVLARDVAIVEEVQGAVLSGAALGEPLWDRDWSVARHNLVFETATLNEAIAGKFGWVLYDPGHGAWIDVFVPGFAQCSVKRDRWNQLARPMDTARDSVHLEKLCLNIMWTLNEAPTYSARLTAMIGSSMTRLAIDDPRLSAAGLLSVLESCSNLRHLKIVKFQPPIEQLFVDASRIVATRLETLELLIRSEAPSNDHFNAVIATLVPVIGANLTRVRIENPTDRDPHWQETFTPMLPFDASFRALVQSCPRLQELVLERLEVNSLDALGVAYEHQTSVLASLRLLKCPIESSSFISFAEALGRPTCRGAKHLKFLHIQHTSPLVQDLQLLQGLDVPSIRALLACVRVNRSLKSLLLLAQPPAINTEEVNVVLSEFKAFRQDDADAYEAQCRVESSTMLVSALQARKLAWNEQTVAQIFEFLTFERRDIGLQFE